MALNPKNVQQAVRLAVALANPVLRNEDWMQLQTRFHLNEDVLKGMKVLIEVCESKPELKLVLSCLTYNA